MENQITISAEQHNNSSWLKVFVPNKIVPSSAVIKGDNGHILKRIDLEEGNNAIDISSIHENSISIKVETPYETVLKHLKINQ